MLLCCNKEKTKLCKDAIFYSFIWDCIISFKHSMPHRSNRQRQYSSYMNSSYTIYYTDDSICFRSLCTHTTRTHSYTCARKNTEFVSKSLKYDNGLPSFTYIQMLYKHVIMFQWLYIYCAVVGYMHSVTYMGKIEKILKTYF